MTKSEQLKLRYQTDPEYRERKKAIAKAARDKDKDRRRLWAQTYRDSHREAVKATAREWYQSKPDDERQDYAKSKYYKDLARSMYQNAKGRAKRNGIPFEIVLEDVVVPTHCPVLGLELVWRKGDGRMNDSSPSLDRMVPDRGYVPGNVSVISWKANRLKSNATTAELQAVCDYMRTFDQCI